MSNNIYYYGGIVARISGHLHDIDQTKLTDFKPNRSEDPIDLICDLSADAGRVFHTIEDLSSEHFIDWSKAIDHYSKDLKHFLLSHRMPAMADMISLAANSIDLSRPDQKTSA